MQNKIKAMFGEIVNSQHSVKQHQHFTDKLKREVRYGINGESAVSQTSISDMAKLSNSVTDFILNSAEYSEEDKKMLLDMFDDGKQVILQYD